MLFDKAMIEGLAFAIVMCGWIAVILKVNPIINVIYLRISLNTRHV